MGAISSSRWLKALILASSFGLASSGLAVADGLEAEPTTPSSTPETPVAEPIAAPTPHQGSPSVQLQLSAPTVPTAQPSFSPTPAAPPVAQTSPPHVTQSMQPPVPPPTAAAIVIPAPAATPTMAESLLQPATTPLANATSTAEPGTPSEASSAPSVEAPSPAPPLAVPDQIAADESVPSGYNSVFIDPTSYGVGATQAPAAPTVVFSERSTGCQISIAGGQTASSCQGGAVAGNGGSRGLVAGGTPGLSAGGGGRGIPGGPVTVAPRGVSLGSTTVVSRDFLNEKLRPLNVLRRGNEEYVFPLSIPSAISSVFGWRMHPIHQTWRFHSGTDLAAPMGTPVLATQAGRVAVADFLGGYGLTVILRHGDGNLESRYAHLSQVAVRSGEWVEQGEVIGLVGSTGASTGPHLHFEVRQLTSEGWVAMDPGEVLEYGIANLMNIMNNPMVALGRSEDPDPTKATNPDDVPVDYPFRPAQPNAS